MTPQELVLAAQAGNRDAFAELWRLYRDEVAVVIYRRTHNRHLTEDLTSETFLRAWRRLPAFTWRANGFAGWVVTIAINLTADHFGSAHQRYSRPYDLGDSDTWQRPTRDRRAQPEHVAEQVAVAEALDAALATLTPTQREALAWRFGADLRIAEASMAMGRGQKAVQSAQHKAIVALRRHPAIQALAVAA